MEKDNEDYLNIQRVFDKFTTREYQHTLNCHIFNLPVPDVSLVYTYREREPPLLTCLAGAKLLRGEY